MSFRDEPGPRSLSSSLNQQLHTYGLAASAAGVAVFSLVQPVHAEIVYTPVNIQFNVGVVNLDLNSDGAFDLRITGTYFAYHQIIGSVLLRTPKANAVEGINQHPFALSSGAVIGPAARFGADNGIMAKYYRWNYSSRTHPKGVEGYWRSANDKYIGLRFQIGSETHYGWVRATVTSSGGGWTTNITGYAYETVANQSIVAGQTSGGAHPAKSELMSPDRPAFSDSGPTLGMLAAGALAQPLWRREGDSIS